MSSRRFVKQGDKIIVKEDVKPVMLDSKNVIMSLQGLKSNINKAETQLKQLDFQKTQLITQINDMKDSVKELGKHEEWAESVQVSKLKNLIPDATTRAVKKVLDDYEYDEMLMFKDNITQMRHQVQAYIGRDDVIAEMIAPTIIQKHVYVKSMIPKQWSDVENEENLKKLLKK